MELSKFIEEDMVEFLDAKSQERREELNQVRIEESNIFSVERDYAAETRVALAKNDNNEAKRIFDELRDYYNTLSKTSEEKEKIYAILQEVFTLIKEHFAQEKGETLQDEIKDIEEHGISDAPLPMHNQEDHGEVSYDAHIMEEKTAFAKAALMAQQQREGKDQELTIIVNKINKCVEKEDVVASVTEYRKLKELFSKYPSDDKFRKVEWYNQVLSLYEQIKQLQQRLKRTNGKTSWGQQMSEQETIKQTTPPKAVATQKQTTPEKVAPAEKPNNQDVDSLLRAKTLIKQAIDLLNNKDLHGTENTMISATHAVTKIPDGEAKRKLEHIINQINSKVQFAKQHEGKDDLESLYEQAIQAQNAGQKDLAISLYKRVLGINPNHLQAKVRLQQLRG